jgi:hypothetical protein
LTLAPTRGLSTTQMSQVCRNLALDSQLVCSWV